MSGWRELRDTRLADAEAAAGYAAAQFRYELGNRIRVLREEEGLSQAQLAARAGTSQAAIARLEAGGVEPRLSTLTRISRALGAELQVDVVRRLS